MFTEEVAPIFWVEEPAAPFALAFGFSAFPFVVADAAKLGFGCDFVPEPAVPGFSVVPLPGVGGAVFGFACPEFTG